MNDAIGLYLNDIGKVALLTAEDERTLSKAIEKGREAAALYEAGEKTAAVRKDMKAAAVVACHAIRDRLIWRQYHDFAIRLDYPMITNALPSKILPPILFDSIDGSILGGSGTVADKVLNLSHYA